MNEFLEPFERMLETIAMPAQVRAVEAGAPAGPMWDGLAGSGFLDALVPEERGGAGLPLMEVHPLWQALGRHAVPLPVGETMIARFLLAVAGSDIPEGAIAIVEAGSAAETIMPFGLVAEQLLVEAGGRLHLVPTGAIKPSSTGVTGSVAARVHWEELAGHGICAAPEGGLRAMGAILRATLMAGAADRLLEMTAAFANERIQFGKPIGRQQALQQNLAMMAEDVVASRVASQIGCAGGLPPSPVAAAIAKSVTSSAAARIAATAHAVHGALGISDEHDLQFFTRRLYEWRLADGAETYWNRALGAIRLAADMGSSDFVRMQLTV